MSRTTADAREPIQRTELAPDPASEPVDATAPRLPATTPPASLTTGDERAAPEPSPARGPEAASHAGSSVTDSASQRSIPDFDLYLFNQGEHRRIHRYLGAHGVDQGVRFAVWAPNARHVSVVGSFNDWDILRHPLAPRGTTGVWERFIAELRHGFTYKFAIERADGSWQFRNDPFARFIHNEPNRTPEFHETYYEFKHPKVTLTDEFKSPLNIYEVHPLSWRHRHGRPLTYLELIDELVPYVKWMDYTHVELMGILEHPYVPSWGYQVIGFYAPTSRMGTPGEFKQLVDAFHREGIGVIVDMVLIHFPKDLTGLAQYDGDNLFESPIPERKMTPWDTFYFDFARNEVRSYLISCLFHWIEEFYIDGFRFDAAGHFHYLEFATEEKYKAFLERYGSCRNPEGFRFMQSMTYAVKHDHPKTLLIAEDSTIASGVTRPVEHGGHGFDYKWDLGCTSHMMKFFRAPFSERRSVYNDLTYPMLYSHSENFLLPLGHDEVVHMKRSMLNKTEDLSDFDKFANLRLLYLLQFGYPHKKLLFMGQEFAQRTEWNDERPLPWECTAEHLHGSMQWYVKRLNEVYKYLPAVHEGDNMAGGFEWVACHSYQDHILAFLRYDQHYGEFIVFLLNLSKRHFEQFRLGVPFAGDYYKVIDTDAQEFGGHGHNWVNEYHASYGPAFGHENSFVVNLLPLHGMMFKAVNVLR